jgi:hypothetical protein
LLAVNVNCTPIIKTFRKSSLICNWPVGEDEHAPRRGADVMTPGVCLNFEDLAQNTGSVDANDSHPSPPAKTSAKTTTLKRFAEVSPEGEG